MIENDTNRKNAMQTNENTNNHDDVMGHLRMLPESNKPKSIGSNFLEILRHDNRYSNLRLNTVRWSAELYNEKTGRRQPWSDADDAAARIYIEEAYGLSSKSKYEDAIHARLREVEYNPVQIEIEKTEWDGQHRAEEFLIRWAGADDTPVNRECSRLLFAGGIRRAYQPGSKFDNIIVLIGGQGSGKSTLCKWLALDDDFYTSIKTIKGQKGSEAIQGKWIIEVEELLAFLANDKSGSVREEEAKAFLSRQSEYYRKPYERHPSDTPRTCIFMGTTNRDQFLTDPTGNRRWFPVRCNGNGKQLYEHETECRAYIRQAWAEMLVAFKSDDELARPTASPELEAAIKAQQETATTEEPWAGLIDEYARSKVGLREGKPSFSILELWKEAINYGAILASSKCDLATSNKIAGLLRRMGWESIGTVRYEGEYGIQQGWKPPFEV